MQGKIKSAGHVLLIPQEKIRPNRSQPRTQFDADSLEGLAQSIRQNGVLQPLIVRRLPDGSYELIAGERRLRAARIVGVRCLPCMVMDVSDECSAVFALLENVQRQDLGCFEEAEAILQLIRQFDLTQDVVAARLGKSPSTISNKLRLLRLPEDIRQEIIRVNLTERHARALLRLDTAERMRQALTQITQRHLSAAQTDAYISKLLQPPKPQRKEPLKLFKDVRLFVNTLNHAVDTMRRAGIAADAVKTETGDYIEYVVRIPKSGAQTDPSNRSGA